MTKKILFCLFIISNVFAFAQQPPLNIDENFDNTLGGWFVGSKENYNCKIEDGKYVIDYFPAKETNFNFFWRSLIIDETKDFIIEAKMRHISGKDDNKIGLSWGCDGWKNSNFLSFSGNQFYQAGYYVDGAYKEEIKWTKNADLIKPSGEYNTLRAYKKGVK